MFSSKKKQKVMVSFGYLNELNDRHASSWLPFYHLDKQDKIKIKEKKFTTPLVINKFSIRCKCIILRSMKKKHLG